MSALLKATRAWGEDMPDWVRALAEECERSSQNKAGQRIGASGTAVSQILGNTYPASSSSMEKRVRGALMSECVQCPQLGEIATNVCLDWQAKSKDFMPVNSLRVSMFKACRNCPLLLDEQ